MPPDGPSLIACWLHPRSPPKYPRTVELLFHKKPPSRYNPPEGLETSTQIKGQGERVSSTRGPQGRPWVGFSRRSSPRSSPTSPGPSPSSASGTRPPGPSSPQVGLMKVSVPRAPPPEFRFPNDRNKLMLRWLCFERKVACESVSFGAFLFGVGFGMRLLVHVIRVRCSCFF